MNDRRFKELVNLHLDHRLSGDEAEELEQALITDPARRRVLASYAAMQHSCSELCRRSASGAPAPQAILRAIRDAERKAEAPARPTSRAWAWGTWSTATGLAAMAVFMVVRVERPADFAAADSSAPTNADLVASVSQIPSAPALAPTTLASASAAPSTSYYLPPHLTLAALGISNETREVGVVSNWSHPLNDITEADIERAALWARGASRPEWAVDIADSSPTSAAWLGSGPAMKASSASFTFER